MPDVMSVERVALLRHLVRRGRTHPRDPDGRRGRPCQATAQDIPDAVMLDQFTNAANPEVHRRTTAVEVWDDTAGLVDVFVSAVGTGGTITGVGEVLKARKPSVRVVAVEPAGAAVLWGGRRVRTRCRAFGVGFVPAVLNRAVIDEIAVVTDDEAFECARQLAEGRDSGWRLVRGGGLRSTGGSRSPRIGWEDDRGIVAGHGGEVHHVSAFPLGQLKAPKGTETGVRRVNVYDLQQVRILFGIWVAPAGSYRSGGGDGNWDGNSYAISFGPICGSGSHEFDAELLEAHMDRL